MSFTESSYHKSAEREDWLRYHPKGRERVLLREAELCGFCGKKYLSLYPLRFCLDHDDLEGI
ncbi:MAG: hypothetical protein KAT46_07230 [Deltaproteobacteria bacterium]|nr:hypothetical protein [Deltaproteobacteria bacterium]